MDGRQSKGGTAAVKATDVGVVMEAKEGMQEPGIALFDTPIGLCGIAWSAHGLRGVQLPETVASAARTRLTRRFPGSPEHDPPASILAIIETIRRHLRGSAETYDEAVLDFAGIGAWEASVYRAALAIRYGETRTYGALAASLGAPRGAQAVGQALGRNPWPIVIPCHRILAADGRTGGFSAPGGAHTKLRLLEIEGALGPASLPLFAGTIA